MWARIFCTIGNVPLSTLSWKGCCVSSSRLRQLDSKQGVGFQLIDWPWYWPFCKNLAFLLLSCNRINFSVYLQGKYLLYIIFCIFMIWIISFYDAQLIVLSIMTLSLKSLSIRLLFTYPSTPPSHILWESALHLELCCTQNTKDM